MMQCPNGTVYKSDGICGFEGQETLYSTSTTTSISISTTTKISISTTTTIPISTTTSTQISTTVTNKLMIEPELLRPDSKINGSKLLLSYYHGNFFFLT